MGSVGGGDGQGGAMISRVYKGVELASPLPRASGCMIGLRLTPDKLEVVGVGGQDRQTEVGAKVSRVSCSLMSAMTAATGPGSASLDEVGTVARVVTHRLCFLRVV